MSGRFRQVEHTADIGFELTGDKPEDLFEAAARALSDFFSDEDTPRIEIRNISVSAEDPESLLVDFLNELIYLASYEGWVAGSASVQLEGNRLTAVLKGSRPKDGVGGEIKAATYHQVGIRRENGRWRTRVFFDV